MNHPKGSSTPRSLEDKPISLRGLLTVGGLLSLVFSGIMGLSFQLIIPYVLAQADKASRESTRQMIADHKEAGVHKGAVTEKSLSVILKPIEEDIKEIKRILEVLRNK